MAEQLYVVSRRCYQVGRPTRRWRLIPEPISKAYLTMALLKQRSQKFGLAFDTWIEPAPEDKPEAHI